MGNDYKVGDRIIVRSVEHVDRSCGIRGDMLGYVVKVNEPFVDVEVHTGKRNVVHPFYPSQIKKF